MTISTAAYGKTSERRLKTSARRPATPFCSLSAKSNCSLMLSSHTSKDRPNILTVITISNL